MIDSYEDPTKSLTNYRVSCTKNRSNLVMREMLRKDELERERDAQRKEHPPWWLRVMRLCR
jgi:hypothetical protein